MEKLIALLLAAVMCLSLAACDNGKTENTDHSQGQNTENTSKENQQTETASQGNGNTEQLTDERYQEGTDPADIDKKYVGVRKRGEADFSASPLKFPVNYLLKYRFSRPSNALLRRASSRAVYPRRISRPFCVLWKCSNCKTFASVSILNNKQPTPKAGVFGKVLTFYPLLGDISWINWMMQVFSH